MIFKFVGKEESLGELFKKYQKNEINSKSLRKFQNYSKISIFYLSHLQILPSFTTTNNLKIVFGCYGGYGYCLGEIEENSKDKNNDLGNIFVFKL